MGLVVFGVYKSKGNILNNHFICGCQLTFGVFELINGGFELIWGFD